MNMLLRIALATLLLVGSAQAQNVGTVTNHAFAVGRGAGQQGLTSLLCGSAQLAVGQSAADPICRTLTGDVTLAASGATTIASARLQNWISISYVQGDVFYYNGTNIVRLPAGTSGNFLKTQGAGANPLWAAVPGGGDLLSSNNLSDVANAVTAFTNIKQAASATVTGVVKRPTMALLRDEKVSGIAGGTFTSGADRVRDLNAETDLDSIVTLAANQFTLGAGTWLVQWSAPAYATDFHQSYLYNATDGVEVKRGSSQNAFATGQMNVSEGIAIFTIAGAKAFEIRHRAATTRATDGFGLPSSFGIEVYTQVVIHSYNQ